LLKKETLEYISSYLWLPNLPDLNPVDYNVWEILQNKVYKTRIADIRQLNSVGPDQ